MSTHSLFQVKDGGANPTPGLSSVFWVEQIQRPEAKTLCQKHPHASCLPKSSAIYYRLTIGGQFAGLAVWGWGVTPKHTAERLGVGLREYLELCRFFVVDGSPECTASKFLATTHRLLKKHVSGVRLLYTYAAGFQGLVGTIYKASGYRYLGRKKVDAFLWIPNVGLVHRISLWHRHGMGTTGAKHWQGLYPGSVQWCGYNFEYAFMLGKYELTPKDYPTEADLEIWTVDCEGRKSAIPPSVAKSIPIVSLGSTGTKERIPISRHFGDGGWGPEQHRMFGL